MLEKGSLIMSRLEEVYPQAPECFLHHKDPFTLLIAVLLSAQSLDTVVNEITPTLFSLADTPAKMVDLGEPKIREVIKRIGLAPGKARNIASLSATLRDKHAGVVPDTFEELEQLAGVGHKTASVVMMQAFKKPAFPVDTHIHRLACRWGCGDAKSVEKTESRLKEWFPDPLSWADLHTRIILFGRQYCPARNHDMDECPICSMAATAEARRANEANRKKFVAASVHKNPYEVRDVNVQIKRAGEGVENHDLPEGMRGKKKVKKEVKGDEGKAVRKGRRRKVEAVVGDDGGERKKAKIEKGVKEMEEEEEVGGAKAVRTRPRRTMKAKNEENVVQGKVGAEKKVGTRQRKAKKEKAEVKNVDDKAGMGLDLQYPHIRQSSRLRQKRDLPPGSKE